MKTILCYGDSNTHGFNPANGFAIRAMCGGRGRWLTCWGRNIMWWRKDATEELPCMQIPWSHGKTGNFI